LPLVWLILTPLKSPMETVLGMPRSTPSNPCTLSSGWGDSGDISVLAEEAYVRNQALLLEPKAIPACASSSHRKMLDMLMVL
jgi:hypothetical protein